MTKERTKKEMVKEILEHQARVNEFIFTKEKLEKMNFEMLSIVCETSKHMVRK